MKKTNKSTNDTSFFDTTLDTTIHTLLKILGQPTIVDNTGMDKTNYEWNMETSDGDVFTVYDWKEYRILNEHEVIEFHIGGHSRIVTEQAREEIYDALTKLKLK